LFDVKGLTGNPPEMGIGSPLFNTITIHLNNKYYKGKQFVIEAKNNSDSHPYIQSMQLNGKPLHRTFIAFADITKGGRLTMQMGQKAVDRY